MSSGRPSPSSSRFSTARQMACSMRRCVSWTSAVRGANTAIGMSTLRHSSQPAAPHSPIVVRPASFAARIALSTLAELPLVLMPTATSPAWPSAST